MNRIVVAELVVVALLLGTALAASTRQWLPLWLEGRTTPKRWALQCLGAAGLFGTMAVPELIGARGDAAVLASYLTGILIFGGCFAASLRNGSAGSRPRG